MIRTIHLHGSLGDEFVETVSLDVRDAAEAVRALAANFPGFLDFIRVRAWHVVCGSDLGTGKFLNRNSLLVGLGDNDLHFVPVVSGSGGGGGTSSKGIGTIILGVVLVVVGLATGTPVLALAGLGMLASGAAALLASTPNLSSDALQSREDADQRPSFLYNGATNTIEQGGPVPVVYGKIRTGAVMVSAGVAVEQLGS